MKKSKSNLVPVAIICGAMAAVVAVPAQSSDSMEEARNNTRIAEIRRVPSMPFYDSGDFAYWEVVRRGLSAVPDLIILVEDTTPSGIPASNYGGEYSLGDLAFIALQDIVHGLPYLATPHGPRNFNEYLDFVRSSPENRKALRSKLGKWFLNVRMNLRWVSATAHPAGGWFELPEGPG